MQAQTDDHIATFRTWAQTPPMGWNSWDCYYSSVTEKEVMQNAQYLVDNNLVQHGWEYVVIDIRWYCNHPSLGGGNYNQNGTQDYVLDEHGRYLPSPTRFPSVMRDGVNEGFKALADKLHAMGLKFGIHIMRGVPKSVVGAAGKYRLKGSENTAWTNVYNGTSSPCTWLKDNLLVKNNKYGQLYYNSIMDLYASWGVDFIKVDDISRPFHTDEIHMIRKAIDQTGRPIVLSLSPGKTQYEYAQECLDNANMWRMMDDLWDNWSAVDAVFNEAHEWSKHARPGNYADCDMLPLGQIAMTIGDKGYTNADAGRWTQLSQNEQLTMMSLWGICHSPLFFGGEMTKNDDFTSPTLCSPTMSIIKCTNTDKMLIKWKMMRTKDMWLGHQPTRPLATNTSRYSSATTLVGLLATKLSSNLKQWPTPPTDTPWMSTSNGLKIARPSCSLSMMAATTTTMTMATG